MVVADINHTFTSLELSKGFCS